VLPASIWTKYPAREPLLMAFMMSMQAILWRSVIVSEMTCVDTLKGKNLAYPERI